MGRSNVFYNHFQIKTKIFKFFFLPPGTVIPIKMANIPSQDGHKPLTETQKPPQASTGLLFKFRLPAGLGKAFI